MKVRNLFRNLLDVFQKFSANFIVGCDRLFKPTDDDYPKTGTQPFEGDIVG